MNAFAEITDQIVTEHKKGFGSEPERMFLLVGDHEPTDEDDDDSTMNITIGVVNSCPCIVAEMINSAVTKSEFVRDGILRGVAVACVENPNLMNLLFENINEVRKILKSKTDK